MLKLGNVNSVAIMGGTFDPIHYGHLVAAETARHSFNLDKVIFMPSGQPPHKDNTSVSDAEHRYLMTVLATAANPAFDVSRLEMDRQGPSFTIDTVREIIGMCREGADVYFITGADAISLIHTWKDYAELLKLCKFIAVTRPGYKKPTVENVHFLEIPSLAISSTDIRARVSADKPIKYLLPDEVELYILKNGLYRSTDKSAEFAALNAKIKKTLTQKRYKHTLGVADEAVRLAGIFGADAEKAYVAAMLHDIAKNLSDKEMLKLCKKYGFTPDDIMSARLDLCHSFIGAEIAREEYRVTDTDILNAIRYHTTGRGNMSLLEKIVYIADAIEPGRERYNGLDKIRALASTDIDAAMAEALRVAIAYNSGQKRLVHPLSAEALEYIERKFTEQHFYEEETNG